MSKILNVAVFTAVASLSVNAIAKVNDNAIAAIANSNNIMAATIANSNNNTATAIANNNTAMMAAIANSNNVMAALSINDDNNNNNSNYTNNKSSSSSSSIYVKAFGTLSLDMKNNVSNGSSFNFAGIHFKNGKKINSLRFALGLKQNLVNGRLFIAPELFGNYMLKNTDIGFYSGNNEENLRGQANLKATFGASVRFGVNLFDEFLSVYVKPNVGAGMLKIKTSEENNGSEVLKNKTQYGLTYGGGVGVDFNIAKYLLLTAEVNYDILPYKVNGVKMNNKMLTFSFGAGFKF